MKLSRTFAEILSSHSTVRRLLHPVVAFQSPLYSTSTSTSTSTSSSSSKAKPKYTRKQVKPEPPISESKDDDHDLGLQCEPITPDHDHDHDLGLQCEPITPKKTVLTNLDLPKPREIPWQSKVANSVNLIGRVAQPLQFKEYPDGKFWAGTMLTQETAHDSSFLWIGIIFEGYLAHIAACHLKEKDLIHVAGKLSGDPPQLSMEMKDGHCRIQVMVDSISFVQESSQGKEGYTPYKQDGRASRRSVKDWESVESSWRDLVGNPNKWLDYRKDKLNGSVKPKHPDFKHEDNGEALWLDSAPKWVMSELQTTSELQITSKTEESSSNSTNKSKASSWTNSKPKSESWKNLVENPDDWWDNRSNKVGKNSPDFKHKETREGLWLSSSPAWVLDKLPPVKPQVIATHKRDTLLS